MSLLGGMSQQANNKSAVASIDAINYC